jgi:hypothetical protein
VAHLEIWLPGDVRVVPLTSAPVTIGRGSTNVVALEADPEVSRLHAVLEPIGEHWCVRDLGSRNGTQVQSTRIGATMVLRDGDELRIGRSRIVFRSHDDDEAMLTVGANAPPSLTKRERDVLLALFRPALGAETFTEPASVREMAGMLFVSEAAVKQHLGNLYDKFGLYGERERRRTRLANEALRRGAVTLVEARDWSPGR